MAELPLDLAIPRFKANEDRMDRFANGGETTTWNTSEGVSVPSLRKFLKDEEEKVEGTVRALFDERFSAEGDQVVSRAEAWAVKSENASLKSIEAAGQAQNLVDAAQAAYVGFQPNTFYDLGRVNDQVQLFPSNLGRVA